MVVDELLQSIYNALAAKRGGRNFWGTGINEFSDEWWRAYLGAAGYSIEGCPNENAYAHSQCGIQTYGDHILSYEYTGLFSIQYAFTVTSRFIHQR